MVLRASTIIITVFLISPFLFLFVDIDWPFIISIIKKHWQSDFHWTSLKLMALVSILSLFWAIIPAWLIASKDFFGRSILSVLHLMPLCIPAYILAYVYDGVLGAYGTLMSYTGVYFDIKNIWGLTFVLSLALYPYVFLLTKISFSRQSYDLINAARSLRQNRIQRFAKVIIPLSLPAIIGGLFLLNMEVLNNFGAVSFYGLKTYTTEIIRLWNPMDLSPVKYLGISLLLLLMLFLILDYIYFRNKEVYESSGANVGYDRNKLSGYKNWLAFFVCLLPVLFALVLPVCQLLIWGVPLFIEQLDSGFLELIINTLAVALLACFVCVLLSLFLSSIKHMLKEPWIDKFSRLWGLGYTVPGVLLGVGILLIASDLSKLLGIGLSLSVFTLAAAYTLRFNAVSYNALDSAFKKFPLNIREASYNLGKNKHHTWLKVDLPLIRPSLIAALILVFVEIIKELPLTMLFHHFNFETLAIRAYILMETDGAIYEASVPSLIIIFISFIPIWYLNSKSQ